MQEEWKPVVGFRGLYAASRVGNIRSIRSGKLLKPYINHNGYYKVHLCGNGIDATLFVHRLVAGSFLGECPHEYQVNHVDGNKLNNAVQNLEYVTRTQNIRHAIRLGLTAQPLKLSDDDVLAIRRAPPHISHASLGRKYDISPSTIGKIRAYKKRLSQE